MNSIHSNHPSGIKIGRGEIQYQDGTLNFIGGEIYFDLESEEQRVCLQLIENISKSDLKDHSLPFSELHLDKPIREGNIPIKHWKVFLLSATVEKLRLDVVISPRIERLDKLLRPKI